MCPVCLLSALLLSVLCPTPPFFPTVLYDKNGKPVARFDNSSTLADVTAAIDPLL